MQAKWAGRLAAVWFSVALALVAGCQPPGPQFSGVIEYRNRSGNTVYVSSLSGFTRPVECGYLVPREAGTSAALVLGRMGYPRQSTITWRVGDGPEKTAVLDLDAVLANDLSAALCLEYTKTDEWKVTTEPTK